MGDPREGDEKFSGQNGNLPENIYSVPDTMEYDDISSMSELEIKAEKRKIFKNVLLISVGFLFVFNAFQGLSRLQSSLHRNEGMGVINSSVLYGSLVLSCLFIPKILINQIGHKWTIPLSMMGYILWMAANGYAVWGTMVTASIIVGLSAAPLWTAQCSYFTIIGARYAKLTKEEETGVVTRLFGIFFFFFQLSGITGSIISSTVLQQASSNITEEDLLTCGADDCPVDDDGNSTSTEEIDDTTVWTMLGIYIAIAVVAVLMVSMFVDNLPPNLVEKEKNVGKGIMKMLTATLYNLRHKEQLILIPLTMYSGFEQESFNAEFTASFVTCSLGIWKVGLVTIPFGVVNALVSFTSGRIAKYTGRIPIFAAGFVVDLAIQITLMNWKPHPSEEYVLYILAGMWGFTDGIWQTQINALYGVTFSSESEAAFSNYRMWESFGFIIAFAYSNFICTSVKLYILTSFLCAGMVGFLIVEYWNRSAKKNTMDLAVADYNHSKDAKAIEANGIKEIRF